MRKKLASLRSQKGRYFSAGILSFCFEITVLTILSKAFDVKPEIAVTIGFWTTLVVSFLLQKVFAFQDYQKTIKVLSRQLGLYAALVLFNYLFTLLVTSLFPDDLVVLSRLISLSFITIWNYFIYKQIFLNKAHAKSKQPITQKKLLKKIGFVTLLSLPIFIFCFDYIVSGNRLLIGDFDYYAQIYEAFRISVQDYGQFPAWNPWLSGGIPAFDNPQFGLISLQSILVLLFGTIYGLKLAFVTYMILGFWGMYKLNKTHLGADTIRAALAGYLWVFCSFFMAHNIMHFTFTLFLLIPWLFLFIFQRDKRFSWLWLGLLIGLIALSSLHYAFLMSCLAISIFFGCTWLALIFQKIPLKKKAEQLKDDLLFGAKSLFAALVICGYRIYTSYSYVQANPRPNMSTAEDPPSTLIMLKALFLPTDSVLDPPKTYWGWWEYTGYMGFGFTLALIACITLVLVWVLKRKPLSDLFFNPLLIVPILLFTAVAFLFTLGDLGTYSPYSLLHHVPGFKETRVSSRWVIFVAFGLLVTVISFKRLRRPITILLALAAIELLISFGPPRLIEANFFSVNEASKPKVPSTFQQYDNQFMHTQSYSDKNQSYFYTTTNNTGQIYGDDSIINTLNKVLGTKRCGYNVDPGCDFVLSDNAEITFWSPNRILLKRTAPGEISLNMNRDAGWRVNNSYIYKDTGILDPNVYFLLPEGSEEYTLIYSPKLSPTWISWKFHRALD